MRMVFVLSFAVACGPDDPQGGLDSGFTTCEEHRYFADADADGHGTPRSQLTACTVPEGYVESFDDCNDADASIHPGVKDACDGVDQDCDGSVDDDATFVVWYADADGDGFGDDAQSVSGCSLVPGHHATLGGDCADDDAMVQPSAVEICNDVDDDCDGLTDTADPDLIGAVAWHEDADGDGYGDAMTGVLACHTFNNRVTDDTDCDDANAAVFPGAGETCDDIDDDCDGLVDDADGDVVATDSFYADADGDGLGERTADVRACRQPLGMVVNASDCDDTDAAVGVAFDAYFDRDGDGWGGGSASSMCYLFPRYSLSGADCDDADAAVHPDAVETCNYEDDDCDGVRDPYDPDVVKTVWYMDRDRDGFGTDTPTVESCGIPGPLYAPTGGDCNDAAEEIHPGALEYCDTLDNDCTGASDDDIVYLDWYADEDGDGFGDPASPTNDCIQPSGTTLDATDCDDGDAFVSPTGEEVCLNGVDEDCDGALDNCAISFDDASLVVQGYQEAGVDVTPYLGGIAAFADLDGNGATDLVVSAALGAAYVVSGPMSGETTVDDGVILSNKQAWDFGTALAGGDANADGYDDLFVSSPSRNVVHLFSGPLTADTLAVDADAILNRTGGREAPGNEMDIVQDVDADGATDVVVSASFGGVVYVAPADQAGPGIDLATVATYIYVEASAGDQLGFSNADLGDMNGDGIHELGLLALPDATLDGTVYVIDGGSAPGTYAVDTMAAATVTNADTTSYLHGIASADYDGDGTGDLLVAAPPVSDGTGSVYAFFGPLSGALDAPDVTWQPSETGEFFGSAVASGDIDGDGDADVLLGDAWEGGDPFAEEATGAVYLQRGPASGVVDPETLVKLVGDDASRGAGGWVGTLPDWDGDGGDEIVVGSWMADRGGTEGAFFVFSSELFF